jgi:predicted outer membrane protein
MKTTYLPAVALTSLLLASACVEDDSNVTTMDRHFVRESTYTSRATALLGSVAMLRAEYAEIQNFGESMITEYENALTDLEAVADEVDVVPPDGFAESFEAAKDRLNLLGGYEFDTAYIHHQVKIHQEAAALFEREIVEGNDVKIRDYAVKYLARVRKNLRRADSLSIVMQSDPVGSLGSETTPGRKRRMPIIAQND